MPDQPEARAENWRLILVKHLGPSAGSHHRRVGG